MDPDANLKEQRALYTEILTHGEDMEPEDFEQKVRRLAELVGAMDEWLSSSGFLPADWRYSR